MRSSLLASVYTFMVYWVSRKYFTAWGQDVGGQEVRKQWITQHHFTLCSTPRGPNPRLVICEPGFSSRIHTFSLGAMNFSQPSHNHCRGRSGSGMCTPKTAVERDCTGEHICFLPQHICLGNPADDALEMKYTCLSEEVSMCSNETLGDGVKLTNGRLTNTGLRNKISPPCQCTLSSSENIIVDMTVSNSRRNCGKFMLDSSINLMSWYAKNTDDLTTHPVHTKAANVSSCESDSILLMKPDAITTEVFSIVLNRNLQSYLSYRILFDTFLSNELWVRCTWLTEDSVNQDGSVDVNPEAILLQSKFDNSPANDSSLTPIQIACITAGFVTVLIIVLIVVILLRNRKKKERVKQIKAVDQVYNNTQSSSDSQCYYEIIPNQLTNPVQTKRSNSRKIYVVNIINSGEGQQDIQQYCLPANSSQAEALLHNLTKNNNTGSERISEALYPHYRRTPEPNSPFQTKSNKFDYAPYGHKQSTQQRPYQNEVPYYGCHKVCDEDPKTRVNIYDDIGQNSRGSANDAFEEDQSAILEELAQAKDQGGDKPQSNDSGEEDELKLTINIYQGRGPNGTIKSTKDQQAHTNGRPGNNIPTASQATNHLVVSGKFQDEGNYLELLDTLAHIERPMPRVTKTKSSALGERPDIKQAAAALMNRSRSSAADSGRRDGRWHSRAPSGDSIGLSLPPMISVHQDGPSKGGSQNVNDDSAYLEPRLSINFDCNGVIECPPELPAGTRPTTRSSNSRRKEYHTVGYTYTRKKERKSAPDTTQAPPLALPSSKQKTDIKTATVAKKKEDPRPKSAVVKSISDGSRVGKRKKTSTSSAAEGTAEGAAVPINMATRALPLTPTQIDAIYSYLH